jgi:hypothetical protein
MELARFGNWAVDVFRIAWVGDPGIDFSITIPNIINTGTHQNGILYQWLIDLAADTRFSAEDIYSLNTAFFYALDIFRCEIEIPAYALIAETLKEQQQVMDGRRKGVTMPSTSLTGDPTNWFGKLYGY